MRRTERLSANDERAACPLYTSIAVIEGRWKPMLFQRLAENALGFGELYRSVPGVSRKVLREQLRQMQADDLVLRRSLSDRRRSVRYELTPHGRSLEQVFEVLWSWGKRHLARRGAIHGTLAWPPRTPSAES
jgi:DNA-binding HxlR family transcriptional regulator